MRAIHWSALLLPLALGAAPGCDCLGERATVGELGVAEFAWDEGIFGCLFGCNAEEAIAVRGQADLVVLNAEDLPAFTVSSNAPAVAEFFHDGGTQSGYITVVAYAAGAATVTLSDTLTDEVIDRLEIEVHEVASIELDSPEIVQTFTIQLGGGTTLWLDLFDDRNDRLVGVGAVDWAYAGGITAAELTIASAIADIIVAIFTGTAQEYADVDALALGSGSIVITAPSGASLELPVAIVDESAIARVTLEPPGEGSDPAVAGEDLVIVDANAFTATDEIVHSPECAWTVSPAGGPVFIELLARDYVSLGATAPGTGTITCIIGAVSAGADVTFE